MSVTEDYLLDEQDKRFEEAAEKASFVSCYPSWFHFFYYGVVVAGITIKFTTLLFNLKVFI